MDLTFDSLQTIGATAFRGKLKSFVAPKLKHSQSAFQDAGHDDGIDFTFGALETIPSGYFAD